MSTFGLFTLSSQWIFSEKGYDMPKMLLFFSIFKVRINEQKYLANLTNYKWTIPEIAVVTI